MSASETAQGRLGDVHRALAEHGWQAGQIETEQPVKGQQAFGKQRVITGGAKQPATGVGIVRITERCQPLG